MFRVQWYVGSDGREIGKVGKDSFRGSKILSGFIVMLKGLIFLNKNF